MPLISVIAGIYNCKSPELLKKSLESVICQTFTDWELLISDDGSPDGKTPALLDEMARLDPRIRILHEQKNGGLGAALNHCLAEAKGEFIARQDDEDLSEPDRFEKQLVFLRSHPEFSFVSSWIDVFDDSGIWGSEKNPEFPDKHSFLWNSPFAHPAMMIRRADLEAVGGYRVVPETKRAEDYDLFMRLYAAGFRGCNLQEILYHYRVVIGNTKYRPMPDRIDEAKVRAHGFRLLHLYPVGIPYVIKPILIGLIPQRLFAKIRRRTHQK